MKIAFYHPWIKSKGGAERLLFEYAERSKHDIDIITHHHKKTFEDYETQPIQLSDDSLPSGFIRKGAATGYKILFSKINLSEYDAFLVSEAGLGCLVTLHNYTEPTICYCHTPLRAAHQFYSDYLDDYGLVGRQFFRIAVRGYRLLEKLAWNKFDSIICNSNNTLQIVESAGLGNAVPKNVIYPGAETEKFKNNGKGNYFFYPSRFKRYKRQKLAIEAFKAFKDEHGTDHKLVLAGYPDDQDYVDKLKSLGTTDITIKTDVEEDELIELYANSLAVLFTAKQEDWGIVPVEAMAAGKPVIAVDEGGPTESIEDGKTGLLTDATKEALALAMGKIVGDEELYDTMSEQALQRSKDFTWAAFTDRMDERVEASVKTRH